MHYRVGTPMGKRGLCEPGLCEPGLCEPGLCEPGLCEPGRRVLGRPVLVCLLFCVACQLDRGPLRTSDGCVGAPEACSGRDDDCDGLVDEGFDLFSDSAHCGACGVACASGESCEAGSCVDSCEAGFADCDGRADNGCEADLLDPTSCGACDVRCEAPAPECVQGTDGAIRCVQDCPGAAVDCGDNRCTDLQTSSMRCGRCDRDCLILTGVSVAACDAGACVIGSCLGGFADCNDDGNDGCETSTRTLTDCGGCGVTCEVAEGTATCVRGICEVDTCEAGTADCDGDSANGCEQSLATLEHCGACDAPCEVRGGTPECDAGACTVASCNAGFGDCDGEPANGCEAELATDAAHCGVCGVACGAAEACFAGSCRDGVVEVAAGADHSCARTAAGAVYCWGGNDRGQLGDGTTEESAIPVEVSGLAGPAQALALSQYATCAVVGGQVFCWGHAARAQTAGSDRSTPIAGLSGVRALAGFERHYCALTADGAYCWGNNGRQQLGDPSFVLTSSASPRPVEGLASPRGVGAAFQSSCFVLATGEVRCVGENGDGQLGRGVRGGIESAADAPVLADGMPLSASAIDLGRAHGCGISGTDMWCWGDNDEGQLGDGTTEERTQAVGPLPGFASVTAGGDFSCGRTLAGEVRCWGKNDEGQLGDSTSEDSSEPVATDVPGPVRQLAAGWNHACAVLQDGGVVCWGRGDKGRLGNGETDERETPVRVAFPAVP